MHQQYQERVFLAQRGTIYAAQDGIVHDISVHHANQAIVANETIMTITPENSGFMVTAEINILDVVDLTVGQQAKVSLHQKNAINANPIDGRITYINPQSQRRGDGSEYHIVNIAVSDTAFRSDYASYPLRHAMPVNVQVVLGQRSVLLYFIGPMLGIDQAYRER